METGPFDEWYASQLSKDDDTNAEGDEWTFHTISHDAGETGDVQEHQRIAEELDQWVDGRTHHTCPGLDLIIAQHKYCDEKDLIYTWLPLKTTRFTTIFKKAKLSPQYFYLRSTGGAHCGAFTSDIQRNREGQISRISSVLRAAHGSSIKFQSMWAFAFTWEAQTGRTIGFFEGFSKLTLAELKIHIKACSPILAHPLTLPEILLQIMTTQLNDRLRVPREEAFYQEERRTRLSNLPGHTHQQGSIWNWGFEDYKDVTARVNQYITTMVYLKRRFYHIKQVTQRLLVMLDELGDLDLEITQVRNRARTDRDERRQRLLNRIGNLESYEDQTECMIKRIENLNNVLYTVLSQIDSKNQGHLARINLQIAHAVRSDSLPVRTIAYITLLLLPGAFVAAIFGMNFFQFDPQTHELIVAKTFWHYWAVSLPVTILVLLIWNVWNYSEKRKDVRDRNSVPFLSQKPNVGGMESLDMDPRVFS